MERRRETRIPVRQQVSVTNLTRAVCLDPSQILDYSGRGLSLLASGPAEVNQAIQIDWNGLTLLGFVCYQMPCGNRYRIGLRLEHALAAGRDLAQLLESLEAEVGRSPSGVGSKW